MHTHICLHSFIGKKEHQQHFGLLAHFHYCIQQNKHTIYVHTLKMILKGVNNRGWKTGFLKSSFPKYARDGEKRILSVLLDKQSSEKYFFFIENDFH